MKINKILLDWYRNNARELPWRNTQNPYSVWVSEIILQQTRVIQGVNYYRRFMKYFPDIKSLAGADINEVLRLWQGLGYYSRARNLHETAKNIVNNYHGIFPEKYDDIIKLKGIGSYTAGAIASIAYNQPVPAIDGNVKRIFSRLYTIDQDLNKAANQKMIENLVKDNMDQEQPGIFNQALMDFGSLVCRPVKPECPSCPLNEFCGAFRENRVSEIPLKSKKTKSRTRYFHYIVFIYDNHFFLEQRKEEDIWKFLYQFPLLESTNRMTDSKLFEEVRNIYPLKRTAVNIHSISDEFRHILSHQKILAKFIIIRPDNIAFLNAQKDLIKVPFSEVKKFAVPKLIDRFVNNFVSLQSK